MAECVYASVCTQMYRGCEEDCVRWKEMSTLLENSQLPVRQWYPKSLSPDDCDYDAFCELAEIKDNIVKFVDEGESLYLYSTTTGNGKTSWAVKLLLKYFDNVWPGNGFRPRGLFVHVPTLLLTLKNFEKKGDADILALKDSLADVDVVVWDDIASVSLSNYDYGQLIMYIDQRVFSRKCNIFTGNLGRADLDKALGSRLASRVWNASRKIQLKGPDKRRNGDKPW